MQHLLHRSRRPADCYIATSCFGVEFHEHKKQTDTIISLQKMAYQNTYGAVPKAAVPRRYEHGYPLPPLNDFAREVEDIDTTPAYPTTAGDHQKEHNGPIMLHEDIDTTPAYPTTVGDHQKEHHGVPGVLHRSGSSSSSVCPNKQ